METNIYDLGSYPLSDRNGSYGGNAGQKEGILIDDEYWMVKYPQSTKGMQNVGSLSTTSSPLSEYIGSHIYEMLGYDVHQTILGIRNDTVVVACKDICDDTHNLREFRELKNTYNKQLNEQLELSTSSDLSSTHDHHFVPLDQVMVHLKYNPELQKIPGLQERFWDCIIVDGFINNSDRNNGNWGVLRSKTDQMMAPVFDNGNSFSPNIPESKIKMRLQDEAVFVQSAANGRSAYSLDNTRQAFFVELLKSDIDEINQAIKRVTPSIEQHLSEIQEFIQNIPKQVLDYPVITDERKQEYCQELTYRYEKMLVPALEHIQETERKNIRSEMDLER